MTDGYRRVERFDPATVEAMVRIGAPPTACEDRGPRIGAEGCPPCVKPDGHDGAHQSDDSWGPVRWGAWDHNDGIPAGGTQP